MCNDDVMTHRFDFEQSDPQFGLLRVEVIDL